MSVSLPLVDVLLIVTLSAAGIPLAVMLNVSLPAPLLVATLALTDWMENVSLVSFELSCIEVTELSRPVAVLPFVVHPAAIAPGKRMKGWLSENV